MKTPFNFGKVAVGENFINRTEELQRLSTNFTSGLNTMLISPRRWGKSSLVKKAAEIVEKQNPKIKVCLIDTFSVNTEKEFYETLAVQILKKSSSKWEEWLKNGKEFLKNIVPLFSIGTDPFTDFTIKFELQEKETSYIELLNLPENIAKKKGIKYVICIDEFQKVGQFQNSLAFQQRLRSVWQHHQLVSYCLYGSKRHVISEMFQNQAMPFYRFGDTMYLSKIDSTHWKKFIKTSFKKNGKTIDSHSIDKIIKITSNHPYYVQQICHQVFINTLDKVDSEIIEKSVNDIFLYNGIMYSREIENLTMLQLNLLRAILNGEKALNSKDVVKRYNLGTSGNILRTKQALEAKEIIDFFEKEPEFVDPLFALWCKENL